jgi:ribonuclease HII
LPPADSGPLYAFDAAWAAGENRNPPLVGADEAGRGSWAGPLVAAAVVLGKPEVERLNDSKTLSAKAREGLFSQVLSVAEAVSVISLPAWWIDRHGVGVANEEALRGAITNIGDGGGCALADGNLRLGDGIECTPRADGSSAAVAAASVVAKVLRDGAMRGLSAERPGYGFERHKGYGTPEHRLALAELGPCRAHRLSWSPVRDSAAPGDGVG